MWYYYPASLKRWEEDPTWFTQAEGVWNFRMRRALRNANSSSLNRLGIPHGHLEAPISLPRDLFNILNIFPKEEESPCSPLFWVNGKIGYRTSESEEPGAHLLQLPTQHRRKNTSIWSLSNMSYDQEPFLCWSLIGIKIFFQNSWQLASFSLLNEHYKLLNVLSFPGRQTSNLV